MTTTAPFTEREEAAEDAADLWIHQQGYEMTGTEWVAFEQGHLTGSAWARDHLAAQEPTDAAQIIDQHREEKRWVGDGVRIECRCRHESSAVWDPAAGPLTEENNTHRIADRLHAAHVADMLARAARRDGRQR